MQHLNVSCSRCSRFLPPSQYNRKVDFAASKRALERDSAVKSYPLMKSPNMYMPFRLGYSQPRYTYPPVTDFPIL